MTGHPLQKASDNEDENKEAGQNIAKIWCKIIYFYNKNKNYKETQTRKFFFVVVIAEWGEEHSLATNSKHKSIHFSDSISYYMYQPNNKTIFCSLSI